MGRLLFLMLFSAFTIDVYAQNMDSVQSNSIKIDSLIIKLDKLQRDYDYLYCDFELSRIENKLNNIANQARISANNLLFSYYHTKFNTLLYASNQGIYNSLFTFCHSLKDSVASIQLLITLKIFSSNFTEEEIELLQNRSKTLNQFIDTAEKALNYYKSVIDMYKELQ
ncbi:MAG: hypothetical protein J6A18_07525 [Alistipes sp.]|nr:hypothetical protein [Alistipes sp.]